MVLLLLLLLLSLAVDAHQIHFLLCWGVVIRRRIAKSSHLPLFLVCFVGCITILVHDVRLTLGRPVSKANGARRVTHLSLLLGLASRTTLEDDIREGGAVERQLSGYSVNERTPTT